MNRPAAQRFTLLEVVLAIAVLAVSIGAALSISAQAKLDIIKTQQRWNGQHALEQATEFFLLTHPRELDLPPDLLPDGYDASCAIYPVEYGLPEYALEPLKGWILAEYVVTVTAPDGRALGTATVQKIVREDDL